MSGFSRPIAQKFEAILLHELEDGGTVRSLGVLYGLLMGAADYDHDEPQAFRTVNRAIINATDGNPAGRLDRIKAVGHKVLKREVAALAEATGGQ